MTCKAEGLAIVSAAGAVNGQEVGGHDLEAVDVPHHAIADRAGAVASQVGELEVRLLQHLDRPRGENDEAVGVRDVQLVHAASSLKHCVEDRGSRNGTIVHGAGCAGHDVREEVGLDSDPHGLGCILGCLVPVLDVALSAEDVIHLERVALRLVDEKLDVRGRHVLIGDRAGVVGNGHVRDGADDHLVALPGDLTFVVGVRDHGKNGRAVKLRLQLLGENLRDEVSSTTSCKCSHVSPPM